MAHVPHTIPHQNITALYRRFLRLSTAIRHDRLYPYQSRYNLAQGYPQLLHDLISVSTQAPSSQKSYYGAQQKVFSGWKASRTQIAQHIEIFSRDMFRNTFLKPYNHIYKIPENPSVKPIPITFPYQLGVRTLYFLERAVGLRPYIAYVEYASTPTTTVLQHTPAQTVLLNQYNHIVSQSQHTPSAPSIRVLTQQEKQKIVKVIPVTNNPMCLEALPQDKQAVLYTIHEYLQQIIQNEGKALTSRQQRIILSQLSNDFKDILCNSFIINNNHEIERRLVNNIAKMNLATTISPVSTFPTIVARQQLIQLLKDLQLLLL